MNRKCLFFNKGSLEIPCTVSLINYPGRVIMEPWHTILKHSTRDLLSCGLQETSQNIHVYLRILLWHACIFATRNWIIAYCRSNGWTEWAEIFCGHSWVVGFRGCLRLKKTRNFVLQVKICFKFFFSIFFCHGQRRALQLVSYISYINCILK